MEDINAFVEKATVLEKAVREIADGTFDENNVSLKEYGILTPEEIAEEEAKEAKKRSDYLRRKREKEILVKEEESRKWWEGATALFGPKNSCGEGTTNVSANHKMVHLDRHFKVLSNAFLSFRLYRIVSPLKIV